MKYEQMYDEDHWVQASGTHFTQVCCDCGSAHNTKVTVLNGEEVEVTLYKNHAATRQARLDGTNGVLVSKGLAASLMGMVEMVAKGKVNKKERKLAKRLLAAEAKFTNSVKSGDHLS